MAMTARSDSRGAAKVRLLAVHTTEGNTTAKELRDAAWWTGSSHAINDASGTLLTPADGCVPYERAAWTLRSGNAISENIEQCGWAKWTRADWLARPKLLDTTARWLADRSKARSIPLVKLDAAAIKAGKSGVIGHWDWTQTGDGSHTDPGPNYPWDVVLDKARAYANPPAVQEDDVTPQDIEKIIQGVSDRVANRGIMPNDVDPKDTDGVQLWELLRDLRKDVTAIKAKLGI